MTISIVRVFDCRCGARFEGSRPSAIEAGWRIRTGGPGNALTWWCPACWESRLLDRKATDAERIVKAP